MEGTLEEERGKSDLVDHCEILTLQSFLRSGKWAG